MAGMKMNISIDIDHTMSSHAGMRPGLATKVYLSRALPTIKEMVDKVADGRVDGTTELLRDGNGLCIGEITVQRSTQ